VSDTPRTDALVDEGGMPYDADFARKLERELAAMEKQRDEARRLHCVEITRESMNPKRFTPEWAAKQLGWDCFKEGGGA
jgi:hypothetical protein